MKKAVIAALAALLLFAATACGGSGDDKPKLSTEETKVAKNIADSFSSESAGALTAQESKCFADDFVDTVGVKKLKSSKLVDDKGELNQTDAKFDTELAEQFADSFLGCVEYQKRQAEEIAKADTKIDKAKLEKCLDEEMPESYVKKLIVASYTQTEDSATLLQESTKKLDTCKTNATAK